MPVKHAPPPSLPLSLAQCAVNGINYEKLMENGMNEKVTKLESFFFGYPRITSLHYFPQLSVLCVVNQPIRSLTGLETCKALQELWVCEAALDVSLSPI